MSRAPWPDSAQALPCGASQENSGVWPCRVCIEDDDGAWESVTASCSGLIYCRSGHHNIHFSNACEELIQGEAPAYPGMVNPSLVLWRKSPWFLQHLPRPWIDCVVVYLCGCTHTHSRAHKGLGVDIVVKPWNEVRSTEIAAWKSAFVNQVIRC